MSLLQHSNKDRKMWDNRENQMELAEQLLDEIVFSVCGGQ